VVFITTGKNLLPQVKQEITRQLEVLPRSAIAKKSLQNSLFLLASSLSEAFSFSNMYAPEHLIVHCKNPRKYLSLIQNAGSVFLGAYSPESVGDYASGTNHSLPTSGYARSYSGISVDSFLKKITFQELTKKGLQNISKTVTTMAEAENLEAHANAVNIRL
jgi:histidinol dehydrogenase